MVRAHWASDSANRGHLTPHARPGPVCPALLAPVDLRLGDAPAQVTERTWIEPSGPPSTTAGSPRRAVSDLADVGLSPREVQVLAVLAEGRTNRQIAEELFIPRRPPRFTSRGYSTSSASPTAWMLPPWHIGRVWALIWAVNPPTDPTAAKQPILPSTPRPPRANPD